MFVDKPPRKLRQSPETMDDMVVEEPLLEREVSNLRRVSFRTRNFIIRLISIILAVEGTILLTILKNPTTLIPPRLYNDRTHCGASASTARSLGCRFDAMSLSWMPQACWDEDIYRDMIGQFDNNITFFTMEHQALALSELQHDEYDQVLLTWEGHLISCTYAWKKAIRSVLRQKPLDAWSANIGLIESCAGDLMTIDQGRKVQTHVSKRKSFTKCGLDEDDLLGMILNTS